ncbi:MAG: FAD-binding oxidoreductase [Proteobacteria bacterium]|nr:FAD-binding oxidoreductase [Pseudomonadota bacterium]MBS0574279.1 FAD-binding oxidoreductase [Pseudomonadota bacterium]
MSGFPISLAVPARHPGPPPPAADVVVIGGGVAGVMTAWFLARVGQKVVLCEKGRIAGEQSSRNWGWIRKQGRDPAELPIMIEALDIWRGLEAEAQTDFGFREAGVLYIANGAKDMADYEAWLAHARTHGLDTRLLSRTELEERLPNSAGWVGGLLTPSDARAYPWLAVPALAAAAARMGVSVHEDCAVRRLDVAAGRIAGVVTEKGRIRADRVVLAGGAWSSLLARAEGVHLPQLMVRATVTATVPLDFPFEGAAADNHFAFRKRGDGGLTLTPGGRHDFWLGPDAFRHMRAFLPVLKKDWRSTRLLPAAPSGYPDAWGTPRRWDGDRESPFERMRILNPAPNLAFIERIRDQFAAAFPQVGRPAIATAWAGMIDTMPDVVPVIDHAAALPGLTVVTGLSGHGFGIGPGVGRVAADLVMGRDPGHDLTRFRLPRFTDGSEIVIGPSL